MGSCASTKSESIQRTVDVPGIKIAIVGDPGVGKSSILSRYVQNQFSPLYIPTRKVAIGNLVRKVNVPSHATVPITFWDIPGKEDLPLHTSYFHNLDAVIVTVDLSDIESIVTGKIWRDTVLSFATFSQDDDKLDENVENNNEADPSVDNKDIKKSVENIPFLLLGNKSDLIKGEESGAIVISDHSENSENKDPKEDVQYQTNSEELTTAVRVLSDVAENGFVGSVMVSAKANNNSVNMAIQNFLRQILQKDYHIERKWRSQEKVVKEKRPRYEFQPSLDKVGIKEIDAQFEVADGILHRAKSLHKYQNDCIEKFSERCVDIGIIETTKEASLQNCLVALRDKLESIDMRLKLTLQDDFYILEVRASSENAELDTSVRYTIKTFNKEYAVVTKVMLTEYPLAQEKLMTIDAKVERLCEQYKIPAPSPDNQPVADVDLHRTADLVERNRAVIRHVLHECHDDLAYINRSIKQAKAAFVW